MEKWTRLLVVLATVLLLLSFVGLCIYLAEFLHHTLLLFALGGLVAYAFDPIIELLRRTKIFGSQREASRHYSVAAVFFLLIVIFAGGLWVLETHVVREVAALQRDLPHLRLREAQLSANIDQRAQEHGLHLNISSLAAHPTEQIRALGASLAQKALPLLGHLFGNLAESVIVLLIAVYFLIYGHEMRKQSNKMLPSHLRVRFELWVTDVNRILGSFVRGQLIIALVIGAAAAIGCLALGIHAWLLIGLFVVMAALIPVFGPYIGVIPAIIAAVIGPTHVHNPVAAAIIILIYFIIINEWGSKVLYPKLVGQALGLHPVLVLFVLFAGLEIAGVVGVLFAAPFTALAIITIVHLYRYWQDLPDTLLSVQLEKEEVREKIEVG